MHWLMSFVRCFEDTAVIDAGPARLRMVPAWVRAWLLGLPHTDALLMRRVAFRHDVTRPDSMISCFVAYSVSCSNTRTKLYYKQAFFSTSKMKPEKIEIIS